MNELVGNIISHYHIIEEIGRGGMGGSYRNERINKMKYNVKSEVRHQRSVIQPVRQSTINQ
jgi:hypothetical protein